MNHIIDSFKDKTVVVFGDVMCDEYIIGDSERISPEAPIPVIHVGEEYVKLGGAANVAKNIHVLGANVRLVGIVGDDDNSEKLCKLLKEKDIGCEYLVIDSTRPTIIKTRLIARHQQMIRYDRESKEKISKEITDFILDKCEDALDGADAVILSDYNKGFFNKEVVDKIKSIAEEKGIPVCGDPKPDNIRLFDKIETITPNRMETEKVTGIDLHDKYSIEQAADKMMKYLNCNSILITLGEDGIALFKDGELSLFPSFAQEVYDVTGAGDTVIAVFSLALISGASHEEAVTLANLAAGISVKEVGVYSVNAKELEEEIEAMLE